MSNGDRCSRKKVLNTQITAIHSIFPISFVLFLLAYTSALGALDYQDISWKPILLPMLELSIYI